MDDSTFRPELIRGEWRGRRKFGQYDFSARSQAHLDIASVGDKRIGNVQVDCRFIFNESKWGVLKQNGRTWPAGIVRMDLSFSQTKGYKLMWATIQVTLDGEHKDLQQYQDKSIKDTDPLVCMTQWYGPNEIIGPPITVSEKKMAHITPNVTFPQGGIGGIGHEGERSFDHDVRWSFTGEPQMRPGSMTYNALKWQLQENDLETQSSHGNTFRTAFAFINSGQPFLLRVEIEGGLHKKSHRLMEKAKGMLKFGSGRNKEENISTTLVRGFTGQMQPLNELVDRLNEEMKRKNRNVVHSRPPASPADSPAPSLAEARTVEKPSTESKIVTGTGETRGKSVSAQDLRDMVRSRLIPPDGKGNFSSKENGNLSGEVVDEKSELDGLNQSQRELQAAKTFLQTFLLQVHQGWLWLLLNLFSRNGK